jgi:hypothetical protein
MAVNDEFIAKWQNFFILYKLNKTVKISMLQHKNIKTFPVENKITADPGIGIYRVWPD